jgi:hypothetical protein
VLNSLLDDEVVKEGETADPGVEIQGMLRKTIKRGIVENALEGVLRGKERDLLYMVGRKEGRTVVLRAETEKLRLMVDDEEGGEKQGRV